MFNGHHHRPRVHRGSVGWKKTQVWLKVLIRLASFIASQAQSEICTLVWGSCCHFLQHKRWDQRALSLYAIGCLPSLPCRRRVKPANSAGQEGESQLGDWLPQKRKEEMYCSSPDLLLQGGQKSPAEWAWLPSLDPLMYQGVGTGRVPNHILCFYL